VCTVPQMQVRAVWGSGALCLWGTLGSATSNKRDRTQNVQLPALF
jgi:hypothetical protein